jgi:hypothetical protein
MFVLRYFEDKDNPEIARMLKTSAATVAVTLHRTRWRLAATFRGNRRNLMKPDPERTIDDALEAIRNKGSICWWSGPPLAPGPRYPDK